MGQTKTYTDDKLEFRQIVLEHIKRILEISSSELRNKTVVKTHENYTETIVNEDTRKSYIQAIENLAYILIPYFDDKVKSIYDKAIKVMDGLDYEVYDYCKEEYEEICKKLGKKELGHSFVIEMQLRYAKKLFIALNLLLNQNDYLKGAVYGEDNDELISDEDVAGGGE